MTPWTFSLGRGGAIAARTVTGAQLCEAASGPEHRTPTRSGFFLLTRPSYLRKTQMHSCFSKYPPAGKPLISSPSLSLLYLYLSLPLWILQALHIKGSQSASEISPFSTTHHEFCMETGDGRPWNSCSWKELFLQDLKRRGKKRAKEEKQP